MEVFAVTIFMSLLFAVLFAVLFFAERSQRDRASIEQVALLPLDDGAGGARGAESGEGFALARASASPASPNHRAPPARSA